ncbi:MAG: YXWGXW repeat-containing protein, partial [Usitatibacteraceae bacterium]
VTIPSQSEAYTSVGISINVPPPPARYEVVPAPRRGYVWVPGYWDWRGRRHVWVNGVWARERRGYVYRPHTWEQRGNGWYLNRGNWDRDRDGVPNRYDRHPNNPYRPESRQYAQTKRPAYKAGRFISSERTPHRNAGLTLRSGSHQM